MGEYRIVLKQLTIDRDSPPVVEMVESADPNVLTANVSFPMIEIITRISLATARDPKDVEFDIQHAVDVANRGGNE